MKLAGPNAKPSSNVTTVHKSDENKPSPNVTTVHKADDAEQAKDAEAAAKKRDLLNRSF